jgi:hypothetical protein
LSFGRKVSTRRRILSATWALVINVVLWIVIPYYLGVFLVKEVPDIPLAVPSFVYEFGALFITLDVGAAFFQGTAISVPFLSGAAALSAVYLWFVTNGGHLQVTAMGTTIGLGFQLLVYVFVLPSIWGSIRAPLSYLVWRRGARAESMHSPGEGAAPA